MKVKCIYNQGIYLPKDMGFNEDSIFSLERNKEYIVYAMTINEGYVWYYICDNNFSYYPVWKPCPLFEIVDNRISRYWVFSYKKGLNYTKAHAIWSYPEWADDPNYYDKLTDGDKREVSLFKAYKEKMYFEFSDSIISDTAQIGDKEWLICPCCIDAWQLKNDKDALVKCPKCQKILNNPRYKNEWPYL
jgi:hypothetical protein